MEIEDVIKKKIKEKERKNIVYIHPIIPNEEIAKYISAFSNEDGGIILFGVKDDGKNLLVKNSAFRIIEKEKIIRSMLEPHAKFKFGELYEAEEHKLEYISVDKNKKNVCFEGEAYTMNSVNNKPQVIKNKKVFLSYCQKDSVIADIVEEKIKNQIKGMKISRDIRDVGYKESFSKFMQSIGDHDYVITIISDYYLKSRNCMYEMLETMRDRKFINKLFYIVIFQDDSVFYENSSNVQVAADIYSTNGQTNYIKHWKSVDNELRKTINELGDPLLISNHAEELKVITKIEMEIQEFMKILSDGKGISFGDMLKSNFKDIISCIENQS